MFYKNTGLKLGCIVDWHRLLIVRMYHTHFETGRKIIAAYRNDMKRLMMGRILVDYGIPLGFPNP